MQTTHSFRELYRVQILAQREHDLFQRDFMPPVPALGPEVSEYIFSYELWHDGNFVGETSGDYMDKLLLRMHENFTTESMRALQQDINTLSLRREPWEDGAPRQGRVRTAPARDGAHPRRQA